MTKPKQSKATQEGQKGKKRHGPSLTATKLAPCPKCGEPPIMVRHLFNIPTGTPKRNKRGWLVQNYATKPAVYLHCECGHCTTDWHFPSKGEGGRSIPGSEIRNAVNAYRKGQWVVTDETDEKDEE